MSDETDPWSHRTARLWLHAVQGQLGRLHEAEHVAARLALDRPPRHYGWKDALPMYDVDIEKHFFINAARQLSLALEALPSPPAPRHDSALLSALRNASKHALEGPLHKTTKATLTAAQVTDPNAYTWTLDPGGGVIGGVLSVLDVET